MFSFLKRFFRKKSLPERISPEEPFSGKSVLFPVFSIGGHSPLRWRLLYDIEPVEIAAETTLKFSCGNFSSKEEALLFSESLGREAIVLDFEIAMGIFAKTGKLVDFFYTHDYKNLNYEVTENERKNPKGPSWGRVRLPHADRRLQA